MKLYFIRITVIAFIIFAIIATIIVVKSGYAKQNTTRLTLPDNQKFFIKQKNSVLHLSTALRIKTISNDHHFEENNFKKFLTFIDIFYPEIKAHLIKKSFGKGALLYEWPGTDPKLPAILLMAHYDVVPVENNTKYKWLHLPFSGDIGNGYIWGRGALDDKSSLIAILETVNHLLKTKYKPKQTIYFAFGGDEEIGGMNGNALIANYLISKKINISFILDEGLPITSGLIPGINQPVAAVGVAEKGYLSVMLVSKGDSGHSSIPLNNNAILKLVNILNEIQAKPLPPQWNHTIDEMFSQLSSYMPFAKRIFLKNMWLTKPIVIHEMLIDPTTNALISTTFSPTILHAGIKDNVIPSNAEAVINFRLAPGDNMEKVLSYLHTLCDSNQIEIIPYKNSNHDPIPEADLKSKGYQILSSTISQIFPETITVPSLMIAATDSRYYASLTKNIYRFYPWILNKDDIKTIHGNNERISINSFLTSIKFYETLIRNASASTE